MVNEDMELPAGMTDLAEILQGPDRVAVSQALRDRMTEAGARVRAELATGVPPESAVRYNTVLQALVAAERVVLLAGISPQQAATKI